jgi:hypothetical protein
LRENLTLKKIGENKPKKGCPHPYAISHAKYTDFTKLYLPHANFTDLNLAFGSMILEYK